MTRILYLPVESKVRELDGKMLIASEAVRRGYTVLFGSKSMLNALGRLPGGILLYKDASAVMLDRFKMAREVGHKVVVHDEEGLVQQSWEDYLNRRIRFDTLSEVDLFLCWGAAQHAVVSKYISDEKLTVKMARVGHPRIDLLKECANSQKKTQSNLQERVILVNTKLAEVNHRQGPDGWINILKDHHMIRSDEEMEYRLQQIKYKGSLFRNYIELISYLSISFPQARIIVRPHPAENADTWKREFKGKDNIAVADYLPIDHWISQSDVVVHTGCTTAIEAFLMNRFVICYKPIPDKRFDIPLPDSISVSVSSKEACAELMAKVFQGEGAEDSRKERLDILKQNIDFFCEGDSYLRVVDELDRLDVPTKAGAMNDIRVAIELRAPFLAGLAKNKLLNRPLDSRLVSPVEMQVSIEKVRTRLEKDSDVAMYGVSPGLYILRARK